MPTIPILSHRSPAPLCAQLYTVLLKLVGSADWPWVNAYCIRHQACCLASNRVLGSASPTLITYINGPAGTGYYLCDNIGLVLVCLPSGSTDVTTSPSRYMTQPSGIPILSPVLFMHVGDPYIPLFKIQRIFDLLVSPPFLVSFRPVAT